MSAHQDCQCFFNSLSFYYEPDFYNIIAEQVKTAYKKASLQCHPVGTSGKRMACEPGKKVKKYRLGESARRGARTESERRGARKRES